VLPVSVIRILRTFHCFLITDCGIGKVVVAKSALFDMAKTTCSPIEDWTIENLLGSHRSRPYNPDIANAFFRAGEIETWGRGIERIINGCKDAGCPEPTF
jgi:hypothetical protein